MPSRGDRPPLQRRRAAEYASRHVEAPPLHDGARAVDAGARRRGRRLGRGRGAARDPDRRRARRGDDADARARRGARARLRLTEGCTPVGARVPDDLAANTVEVDAPGLRPRAGAAAASTRRPRAVSAARARSRRSRSRRRVSRAICASRNARRVAAGPPARGAGRLRGDRRPARDGLFSADGELLCVREDVGRHNALDKVIGWAFGRRAAAARSLDSVRQRPPLVRARPEGGGRGCPLLVAVGAPSSLAIELAADRGIDAVRLRSRRLAQRLHGAVARDPTG